MCWDLSIPTKKDLGGIESELDSLIRGKSEKIVVMADARQRWFDGSEAQRERGRECDADAGRKNSVHRATRTGRGDGHDARAWPAASS